MIQTRTLDCPTCGEELLDPIYDLEMGDGDRRHLTCDGCGAPFTVSATLAYDVTADGQPGSTPLADSVLAIFRLRVGDRGRLARDGKPSGLAFEVMVDEATGLPCMAVSDDDDGETVKASILGLWMRGWRFGKED